MVTQDSLKQIRKRLKTTFSTFNTERSVRDFVEREMAKKYLVKVVYTDNRCETIYQEAIKYLEKKINDEYQRIATIINEYISSLDSYLDINENYNSSDTDTFTRLAVGAGAGYIAALVLEGPIGWMIGLGVGIATAYNSYKKKNELINKILNTSRRLNEEVINKISNILDIYIVEDDILLPPKKLDNNDLLEDYDNDLTFEQNQIKNYIKKRGIKYLVHFTDAKNIDSILKNGLCSPREGKKRGIKIFVNDSGKTAHRAEKYMKSSPDDYISVTITTMNVDVLSAFKGRNNIRHVKRILIDPSILRREKFKDVIFCNMNASSRDVDCGNDIEAFENMFALFVEQVKSNGNRIVEERISRHKPDNVPTHRQAEILIQSNIHPIYFLNTDELKTDGDDSYADSPFGSNSNDNDLPF